MKISFAQNNSPLTQGLAATLSYCGHDTILWDKHIKPTFDMFEEFKPDIVMCYTKDIDNCLVDAIKEYQKPCVVLETEGIFEPFIAFNPLPASNPVQYGKAMPLLRYKTDVMYFSYIETLKGIPFLDILTEYNFKIFGPKKIPYPQYLGYLPNIKEYSNAMRSTKVFIDINGYDVLNASLLGINTISYGLNPLIYPNNFRSFTSISELTEHLNYKLKHPKFDIKQKEFALENTFFHRVYELFQKLGNPDEAQGIMYKWHSIRSEF